MKDTLAALERDVVACHRCPRLVTCRESFEGTKRAHVGETYWAKPVPGFGDPKARVVVVGLAPAAHGANRTGRMFTGDGTDPYGASEFLMRALHRTGYASLPTSRSAADGLVLTDLWLTAIVRCVPPANRPTTEEIATCGAWMHRELPLFPRAVCVIALGKLSFDQMLRHYAASGVPVPKPRPKFAHGVEFDPATTSAPQENVPRLPRLIGSYHPSRQNTATKRVTQDMLAAVFDRARSLLS